MPIIGSPNDPHAPGIRRWYLLSLSSAATFLVIAGALNGKFAIVIAGALLLIFVGALWRGSRPRS